MWIVPNRYALRPSRVAFHSAPRLRALRTAVCSWSGVGIRASGGQADGDAGGDALDGDAWAAAAAGTASASARSRLDSFDMGPVLS